MFILLWEFGSCEKDVYEAKVFCTKKELEDYINRNDHKWLQETKSRVFHGREYRIEKVQVEKTVLETELQVFI